MYFAVTWPFSGQASLFGLEFMPDVEIIKTDAKGEMSKEIASITSIGLIFIRIDFIT